MKVSLQRVNEASAIVLNELGTPDPTFDMAQIGPGLVLTIEVEPDDDEGTLARMAHRVLTLRCFDGPQGRLSLSVQEMHGEILSIPQPLTTLRRSAVGRPQLVSHDAYDEHANLIWIRFNEALRSGNVPVREGRSMAVIIESAVTNFMLSEMGMDSAKEFEQRVLDYIERNKQEN